MKRLLIKRRFKRNESKKRISAYPQDIKKVGIFCSDEHKPDANFITKLKDCFGNQTRFITFAVSKNCDNESMFFINNKAFNLFGKLKDNALSEHLSDLDMVIDVSYKASIIKDYVISMTEKSYKIAMGNYLNNYYHLSINLNKNEFNSFADEIFKYHKILSHAQR